MLTQQSIFKTIVCYHRPRASRQLLILFCTRFFSLMCNGQCFCPLPSCSSSLTTQIHNSAHLYILCKYSIDLYLKSCQKYTRKFTCLTHCISGISLQCKMELGKYLHFSSQIASVTQRLKTENYR